MPTYSIPIYDLYGEAHAGGSFSHIHVETIHVRAQVNSWNILAHRHAALSQMFIIVGGGGTVEIDGAQHTMSPPCTIWLPAGVVHAFRFEPDTDGVVVTLTDDALQQATSLAPECASAIGTSHVIHRITDSQRTSFMAQAGALGIEATSSETGARAASMHHAGLMLIHLARIAAPTSSAPVNAARDIHLAFRALVDRHFRDHWTMPVYARRIGIGADRLHDACRIAAGRPPTDIVHDRIMVEARRALVYTAMNVAGIAYDLGFDDPAYFSRFFARRAGQSPAAFRKAAAFTHRQG